MNIRLCAGLTLLLSLVAFPRFAKAENSADPVVQGGNESLQSLVSFGPDASAALAFRSSQAVSGVLAGGFSLAAFGPLLGSDYFPAVHFNLEGGYRFPQRRAEIRIGLLNLTDQDYRLNPLNLMAAIPRSRTLAVSLKFRF